LQRIAPVTERLSIKINVTEEHLKSGTFEINPGERDIIRKTGLSRVKQDDWEPYFRVNEIAGIYVPVG
jgi:hypothetical protein